MKKMKRNHMLMLGMMISFSALAQEIPTSSVAYVTIPKGLEKSDKLKIMAHSKTMSKYSETSYIPSTNLYKINDISVGIWDVNHSQDDNRSLESIRNEALGIVKLNENIIVKKAIIKSFNNNRFFIFNYQNEDVNYYKFISQPRNRKSINGMIEYKKGDNEKAEAILNNILNSIKFKWYTLFLSNQKFIKSTTLFISYNFLSYN